MFQLKIVYDEIEVDELLEAPTTIPTLILDPPYNTVIGLTGIIECMIGNRETFLYTFSNMKYLEKGIPTLVNYVSNRSGQARPVKYEILNTK